jgi:hypothetical protein
MDSEGMQRRDFIATGAGIVSVASLSGCTSGPDGNGDTDTNESDPDDQKTPSEGRPDGVYVQSFMEEMSMQGMSGAGEYRVGLMYTAPHQFWRMAGTERAEEPIEDDDSLHLMAVVWDPDTGTVVPETGLSVEIRRDGSFEEQVIYPMLSQTMGFHYGANFALDGDGEHTVRVTVGGLNIRRTGSFEGRFENPASTTIDITFDEETRQEITFRELDSAGEPGAVSPMEMMMPAGIAPTAEQLPGTVIGTEQSDDAELLATVIGESPPVGDGDYLAISARTPYNDYLLPAAAFEATVKRNGETVFEGALERTLDPQLKYHYGADVGSIKASDEVTVATVTPPQVARHEGYERAFVEMDSVPYTV